MFSSVFLSGDGEATGSLPKARGSSKNVLAQAATLLSFGDPKTAAAFLAARLPSAAAARGAVASHSMGATLARLPEAGGKGSFGGPTSVYGLLGGLLYSLLGGPQLLHHKWKSSGSERVGRWKPGNWAYKPVSGSERPGGSEQKVEGGRLDLGPKHTLLVFQRPLRFMILGPPLVPFYRLNFGWEGSEPH